MSINRQKILHDLNLKQSLYLSTPLMFSRDSSMETLSSFNVNFHSHNSTYTSEHSTNPSGIVSPSDIPGSPPRGSDDDVDTNQQQSVSIQLLNNTRSTGVTVIHRYDNSFEHDDNDKDSVRNYATSPLRTHYTHDDDNNNNDDDDNNSIHSSLSSLTLPPPPSSTNALLSNIDDLRNMGHNLSVINEESLHEQNECRRTSFHVRHPTTDDDENDDDDDDDEDEDHKGKRLLFELIRQRLPHHRITLTSTSDSSSKTNDADCQNKSKGSSSPSTSSLCTNDQVIVSKTESKTILLLLYCFDVNPAVAEFREF